MRASHQENIGGEGVSRVKADFQRIKWGPVENTSHDLGTDLFVQAWDTRGFSRGLVVGVQVKTGPSYFERPLSKDGEIEGWWYREGDRKHFEEWTAHCLPHLLVLRDLDQEKSYWVHVTADAVVSTGQGYKILVPKAQTIDPEHIDDLYAVACQQRAAPVLEGTSFHGLKGGIPPARLLRYALVAPRLVAPNPNAGHDTPISAAQGLALLAQGRFRSLRTFADEHPEDVADPEEYPGRDWTWGFVSSMWDWALTDSVDRLQTVFGSAPTEEPKAASGVLLACALQRLSRHRQALAVLNHLVDDDDLLPVDHGWVLIQRARTKAEMGDIEDARRDALEAQRYLQGDEDDITVSALSAAAAWHLFVTTDQMSRSRGERMSDFADLVTDSDTAVSWWRSQTVSWGFHDAGDSQFRKWAEGYSPSMYLGLQYLFAAELNADLTGEHRRWRTIAALSAKQKLVRSANTKDPVAEIANGLDLLRRSGDEALERGVKRIIRDGPIEAVTTAVNNVPPVGEWTHTTADTNIRMLALAGSFLDEPAATQFVLSLAPLVTEPLEFTNRLRPSGVVPIYALKAINGLLAAAGEPAQNSVAQLVVSLPDSPPPHLGRFLPEILPHLDAASVHSSVPEKLWVIAEQDHDRLGAAALGWLAANNHPGAESELLNRAASGDLHALGNLGDEVTVLNDSQAATLISMFETKVGQTLVEARRGNHQVKRLAPAWYMTFLNFSFPTQAHWGTLIELLLDPMVAWTDKHQAGWLIARKTDSVPPSIRATLAANIPAIAASAAAGIDTNPMMGSLGTVLAITLGALQSAEADIKATKLVCGSAPEREDAARLLGLNYCPNLRPTLAALIGDTQPDVGWEAACSVGRLLVTDPSTLISVLAWELAKEDGTLLPEGLVAGMYYRKGPLSTLGIEIAQHLTQHPSAAIRVCAWGLLSQEH